MRTQIIKIKNKYHVQRYLWPWNWFTIKKFKSEKKANKYRNKTHTPEWVDPMLLD